MRSPACALRPAPCALRLYTLRPAPYTLRLLRLTHTPYTRRPAPGWVFIPTAVLWCANAASLFFVAALDADDRRWLLAYPVAMFYTCFALITIF